MQVFGGRDRLNLRLDRSVPFIKSKPIEAREVSLFRIQPYEVGPFPQLEGADGLPSLKFQIGPARRCRQRILRDDRTVDRDGQRRSILRAVKRIEAVLRRLRNLMNIFDPLRLGQKCFDDFDPFAIAHELGDAQPALPAEILGFKQFDERAGNLASRVAVAWFIGPPRFHQLCMLCAQELPPFLLLGGDLLVDDIVRGHFIRHGQGAQLPNPAVAPMIAEFCHELRAAENTTEAVIVGGGDRIELVIVAAGARNRQAHECLAGGVDHFVDHLQP